MTDAEGLKLFDVTHLDRPVPVPSAHRAASPMRRRIYLARTYAYVAAKGQGLAIVDITNPERPGAPKFVTFGGQHERRRGRGRRLDQRLGLRLCRRRPQRHEGDPAHLVRQFEQLSTASRRGPSPS